MWQASPWIMLKIYSFYFIYTLLRYLYSWVTRNPGVLAQFAESYNNKL